MLFPIGIGPAYLADLVHPNDAGHALYANTLLPLLLGI